MWYVCMYSGLSLIYDAYLDLIIDTAHILTFLLFKLVKVLTIRCMILQQVKSFARSTRQSSQLSKSTYSKSSQLHKST